MSEQTVKCPICGDPYKVYSHFAGDQSACPECRQKAQRKSSQRWGLSALLVALLLAAPALAQESAADRAERLLEQNPCGLLPGESTAECAEFGRAELTTSIELIPWTTWDPDSDEWEDRVALEASADYTLHAGDPVYYRSGGTAARCVGPLPAPGGRSPWLTPEWVFNGALLLNEPGVCAALFGWDLIGCREHGREFCSQHAHTVWTWSCQLQQWVLGGADCGTGSIARYYEHLHGTRPPPQYTETGLALLDSCGQIMQGCTIRGCPGWTNAAGQRVFTRPTLPPVPDPCASLPPPDPEPPPPDPGPPPDGDLLVEVLGVQGGQWRFALTTADGERTEHGVAPGAVVDVGRGVGFTLPEPPPCSDPEPCPDPELPVPARVVVEVEECRDGEASGRWVVIPDGQIQTWSADQNQRARIRPGLESTGRLHLEEVELRGVACRQAAPGPDPEPPPAPLPPPDPEPPAGGIAEFPGLVHQGTAQRPHREIVIPVPERIVTSAALEYVVEIPADRAAGRYQVHSWQCGHPRNCIPGFILATGADWRLRANQCRPPGSCRPWPTATSLSRRIRQGGTLWVRQSWEPGNNRLLVREDGSGGTVVYDGPFSPAANPEPVEPLVVGGKWSIDLCAPIEEIDANPAMQGCFGWVWRDLKVTWEAP